jgi:hypothetical protein
VCVCVLVSGLGLLASWHKAYGNSQVLFEPWQRGDEKRAPRSEALQVMPRPLNEVCGTTGDEPASQMCGPTRLGSWICACSQLQFVIMSHSPCIGPTFLLVGGPVRSHHTQILHTLHCLVHTELSQTGVTGAWESRTGKKC